MKRWQFAHQVMVIGCCIEAAFACELFTTTIDGVTNIALSAGDVFHTTSALVTDARCIEISSERTSPILGLAARGETWFRAGASSSGGESGEATWLLGHRALGGVEPIETIAYVS